MSSQKTERTRYTGIYRFHERDCDGEQCRCKAAYQATV